MKGRVLKLGTRRSLLAWAQSGWVARELERLNPGLKVELEGIDTRGDKIQDVPLQSVQGKEFFVAELDDALKASRVDLTVHSLKDLSLDRPPEFVCAAIPKRENPRDVALFGPDVLERLRAGKPIRVGTSSPRRIENAPEFLSKALPFLTGKLELVEIRGNVNTRLARVHEAPNSPRHLDGVILAFAGLIRLWKDETARPELHRLLEGVRWMVLPLKQCPAAPGQGALAVECRAADVAVRQALGKLHDGGTAAHVKRERQLLADWGGGCHQKFGATAFRSLGAGELMFVRGRKPDQQFVQELRWEIPARPAGAFSAWDGAAHRIEQPASRDVAPFDEREFRDAPVFVAHSRAAPELGSSDHFLAQSRVWTSGTSSWFRLARQGVWVEGCAEGFGFDQLEPTLREPVLRLPGMEKWKVLTHAGAREGWGAADVWATYPAPTEYPADGEAARRISRATHVFWGSGVQFDALRVRTAADVQHACGPGKTARHLREAGLEPVVFPSVEEWRKWLGLKDSP